MSAALSAFTCSVCTASFLYEQKPLSCPRCNADNALRAAVNNNNNNSASTSGPSKKPTAKGAVKIGTLVIEPFEPYATGIPAFDRVVGGLSKGFSLFIAGDKGVGKSTLVTDIAMLHCLADPSRSVFYASAEEKLDRFLVRAFRLGYGCRVCACSNCEDKKCKDPTHKKVCKDPRHKKSIEVFKHRFIGSRETDIKYLHNQIRKYRPSLIIYDSIRKFKHPDVKTHSHLVHGPEVVGEIVDLTEELKCCAIAIIRLTKDGKLSGSEDMGYDFDAIVTLQRHKPKKSKKPARKGRFVKLTCQKNRMGPEGRIGWFRMTERGMLSVGPPTKKKVKVGSHVETKKQARARPASASRRRSNRRRRVR